MWNGAPPPPQAPYQPGMAPQMPGPQRPKLEPIDWNLVAVLDADLIRRTKDYDSLQRLIQIFIAAKLFPGSSRILAHPLVLRLCQLLQVGFEYMNFCQNELSTMNSKIETENLALKEKISHLIAKNKKAEQIIKVKSQPYDRCPVCEKKFKNLDYVDRHITNRHSELCDSWNIIRGRKPPVEKKEDNIQIILDRIDHLKSTLKRNDTHNNKKDTKNELMATQQQLMDAEEAREEIQMKQQEELRRQLFEAADEFNSTMTLYNNQKLKQKKVFNQANPNIVNLFDPNSVPQEIEVPPPKKEVSPFNVNKESVENFFNQPTTDFLRPQARPSNDLEQGPMWNKQQQQINPFKKPEKTEFQLAKPTPQTNIQIFDIVNDQHNLNIKPIEANNEGNIEPNEVLENDVIYNNVINNNFKLSFEPMNEEDVKVAPQQNEIKKQNPKDAIQKANNFISHNYSKSPKKVAAANIDNVINLIGQKLQNEMNKLGENKAAPSLLKAKYGNNDPHYMKMRKEIQKKLDMEYPMNNNVNKVHQGFNLVHTDELTENDEQNTIQNDKFDENINNDYSSPSKEELINNTIQSSNIIISSEFTSAFEFQPKKIAPSKHKKRKKKIEISEEVSTFSEKSNISNFDSTYKNDNPSSTNKKDEDDWSYINSQTFDKNKYSTKSNLITDFEESTSQVITQSPKSKQSEKDNCEYDFISSNMKPNFSESSPSKNYSTQKSKDNVSNSLYKEGNDSLSIHNKTPSPIAKKGKSPSTPPSQSGKGSNQLSTKNRFKTANDTSLSFNVTSSPPQSGVSSSAIFKSPPSSHSSHHGKSQNDYSSDLDIIPHSKKLSEDSNEQSTQIQPLSEDEFNFPSVTTDSFMKNSESDKDNDEEEVKSNKSNSIQSVLSSARRIDRDGTSSNPKNLDSSTSGSKFMKKYPKNSNRYDNVEDTRAVFQSQSSESPIKSPSKDEIQITKRHPTKKPTLLEYKRIADEKFRKEFDFDLSGIDDENGDSVHLAASTKIQLPSSDSSSSEDESGFSKPPPRLDFDINFYLDKNQNNKEKNAENNERLKLPGIKRIATTNTKYGHKYSDESDESDNKFIDQNNAKKESKKPILDASGGIKRIHNINQKVKYGQKSNDYDYSSSSEEYLPPPKSFDIFKTSKKFSDINNKSGIQKDVEMEHITSRLTFAEKVDGNIPKSNDAYEYTDADPSMLHPDEF
ncbi:hypothetical protein TRFO_34746 [Tritrichomonas foetus]|uniref:C2H2-type domain-containing protein n=1 Tax=Tritrichomonas foetus TaxID=1144522 RepID=A0A1J4JI99_9EUKA|nr:hypothetical protein TRFO_34746 [Tritrichomonas foetus]|eukprot:OHS98912.1 hypothetical protein TRFO_34746 [Tritrichomonas foetus]